MANYSGSDSTTIKFTAGANAAKGDCVTFGNVAGVLADDAVSGQETTLIVSGVVDLPKVVATHAFTLGQKVYCRDNERGVRNVGTSAVYLGDCLKADAANSGNRVKVWLGRSGA